MQVRSAGWIVFILNGGAGAERCQMADEEVVNVGDGPARAGSGAGQAGREPCDR